MPIEMDIDAVRKYCLSFSAAKENLQWGENLCFKVNGKIFAILDLGSVPQHLCFKCTPERFTELSEIEGIIPAPYLARYKWVLLEGLDVLPSQELKDLVSASYEMVAAKARKSSSKKRNKSSRR